MGHARSSLSGDDLVAGCVFAGAARRYNYAFVYAGSVGNFSRRKPALAIGTMARIEPT